MSSSGSNKTVEAIPALCQFWLTLHRRLPRIRLGANLDVSLTLCSALVLTLIRYTTEYIMIAVFGWPVDSLVTKNAAASVTAVFHSINLIPALITCFATCRTYNPSQPLAHERASWWTDTVQALLQFCTGYMIYDGLLNIVWLKTQMTTNKTLVADDYMFLGHHLATTLYMTSTRLVGAGHQSAMMCMLLGELTNPLHNAFYVAEFAQGLDCCHGSFSRAAFAVIEVSFCVAYCLMRAVVMPVTAGHMTYNFWTTGRKRIPSALLLVWALLIWAVILGSIPWIVACWNTLPRYFPTLFGDASAEL